jgi:gamma-glutamylcyclotransferase
MCVDRLRIKNPSAKLIAVGQLPGYKLAFHRKAKSWCGGVADIVTAPDTEMWGAVWELCMSDSDSLDAQEGVSQKDGVDVGHYRRLQVTVTTSGGHVCSCRTYEVVKKRVGLAPSPAYKGCILTGALAVGLPSDYLKELRDLKDNGYSGEYHEKFGPFVQSWLEAAALKQTLRPDAPHAQGQSSLACSKSRPANYEIVMAAARLSLTLRDEAVAVLTAAR